MALYSCPVCEFPCRPARNALGGKYEIDCFRCGKFLIGDEAERQIKSTFNRTQKANLSGYIRRNQGTLIVEPDLVRLRELRTPTVAEKADNLLTEMSRSYPTPGAAIGINCASLGTHLELFQRQRAAADGSRPEDLFPDPAREASKWVSIACAADASELDFLLDRYLAVTGLLYRKASGTWELSPSGWGRVDEISKTQTQSEKAFVAMSFAKELNEFFVNGIAVGVRAAGYEAIRVDRTEHNNKIDDEIIAAIRQTKFTVADFSNNRPSVYFEAGFALGFGRPVIWTVHAEELKGLHFDTRQYNFIRWSVDQLDVFAAALKNRIIATIGRGPLPKAA